MISFGTYDSICLWNASSLSIVNPKNSSQGLGFTEEPKIFKLIFTNGQTKNDFYLNLLRVQYFWTKQIYYVMSGIMSIAKSRSSNGYKYKTSQTRKW